MTKLRFYLQIRRRLEFWGAINKKKNNKQTRTKKCAMYCK